MIPLFALKAFPLPDRELTLALNCDSCNWYTTVSSLQPRVDDPYAIAKVLSTAKAVQSSQVTVLFMGVSSVKCMPQVHGLPWASVASSYAAVRLYQIYSWKFLSCPLAFTWHRNSTLFPFGGSFELTFNSEHTCSASHQQVQGVTNSSDADVPEESTASSLKWRNLLSHTKPIPP